MSTEPTPVIAQDPSTGGRLDDRARLAVGAGLAVAILGLVASLVDATALTYAGIILILAGLVAAGAAFVAGTPAAASSPVAMRDLILAGGTIGAILGILYIFELLFDLDHIDSYGGAIGAAATVALGIAGIILYVAATRWWTSGPAGPWTAALGAEVTTFVVLAALVMRAAGDPDEPLRLPFAADLIALVLTAIAALIAIQHTSALLDEGADVLNWIAQGLYVAGVGVAVVGAAIGSVDAVRAMDPGSRTPTAP